ncbi:hypothetical protein F2Q70_00034932 [Brassica cretica]|uniref:Protein kinase domain-containing protein n=1 Tax=Brassica cretica TaxID=69181 RepID=A0A8S9JQK7_BRACR|nr:hypothetical protein F2Q70_00034932 [Brassica cretica]
MQMRREAFKAFTTDTGDDITTSGSLQFEFKAIEAATSNFHNTNKLGHGGFGEVYKGTLPNGTYVAVKRLSKLSGQGEEEFKNEVFLVAKLQHKNLVRLLGFSVKGEEKILVYEFLPNKSLDHFLFDPAMEENYDRCEVIRCIHIGLLCVQENHADRPTMFTIFRMLTNASITLHMPQPPGFVFKVRSKSNPLEERSQSGPSTSISITCVSPR